MANNLISFIILAWCIFDYFKCNHISFNQITLVLIVVILIILPYSQKLKFFGIEFTRFKVPQRRKITENDNQTNKKWHGNSRCIFSNKATETAIIHFKGIAAREVSHEQWHPLQVLEWIDSETLQLSVPYYDATELIMDILRWGEMAEVMGPQALRQKVATIFENCKKKYDSRKDWDSYRVCLIQKQVMNKNNVL